MTNTKTEVLMNSEYNDELRLQLTSFKLEVLINMTYEHVPSQLYDVYSNIVVFMSFLICFLIYSSLSYSNSISMLFSHLMAVSRVRAPVLMFRQRTILPSTVRYFSVSKVRTSGTDTSGSAELDSLLNSGAPKINTSNGSTTSELIIDAPSSPPPPPSDIFSEGAASAFSPEVVDFTNLIEPSFASLGLTHGWPSGWMQTALEFMHIDIGQKHSTDISLL